MVKGREPLRGRHVVMTGASGFVGRHVAPRLIEAGARVTALVRSRRAIDRLAAQGVTAQRVPLRPDPALAAALEGADTLVHLAYDVRAGAEDNLAAFAALTEAAARAGVGHIVHFSSAVVYDAWPRGPLDESGAMAANAIGYRGAKVEMEHRLEVLGLPVSILQPTVVYGPGHNLWTDRAIRAMEQGGIVLPDPPGRAPLIWVDDVARATILAAATPADGVERYLLNGPPGPTWQGYFEAFQRWLGQGVVECAPASELLATAPPATASGPTLAARLSAGLRRSVGTEAVERLAALARRVRPRSGPGRPGAGELALFAASPEVSTERARQRLGFSATTTFEEGFAAIVDAAARGPR